VARPLIGVSCYVEQARWGVWDVRAAVLPTKYLEKVAVSGGVPVVVPPVRSVVEAAVIVARLDGLVLAGGGDIEPARYGAQPHPETTGIRVDRDVGELALLTAAREADLPVLGICRGMELLCVHAGGRLDQHLPDSVGHHRHRPGSGVHGWHPVDLDPASSLGQLLGAQVDVPSYHHQGVADPGALTVAGRADDGTIEAVEDPARRFTVGVLWHPEISDDDRLFGALAGAAAAGAAAAAATPPHR